MLVDSSPVVDAVLKYLDQVRPIATTLNSLVSRVSTSQLKNHGPLRNQYPFISPLPGHVPVLGEDPGKGLDVAHRMVLVVLCGGRADRNRHDTATTELCWYLVVSARGHDSRNQGDP